MATKLPVESSWRMVEGEHESFGTSVVSNDNANETSNDPFQAQRRPSGLNILDIPRKDSTTLGAITSRNDSGYDDNDDSRHRLTRDAGDSYSSVATSAAGSTQEDDLHAFLRKAARDDEGTALLRSPFQPSLPSSIRQSPLGHGNGSSNSNDATPEPALRMPVLDLEGVAQPHGGRRFGASETGSPMPRRRRQQQECKSSADVDGGGSGSGDATGTGATKTAWPRLLLLLLVGVAGVCCCGLLGVLPGGTAAQIWRLPGLSLLSSVYVPAAATATPSHDRDPSLAEDVEALMHWQTQLVDVVRARVPTRERPGGGSSSSSSSSNSGRDDNDRDEAGTRLPRSHDAWLVPRVRTKALRSACGSAAAHDVALRRVLDAYLDDVRNVSAALARLQAGAAAVAAGPLTHRTHQTLAQLRRLASTARPAVPPTALPLRDAYRRHAAAVLAKAAARVRETAAVVAALDAAGQRLDRVADLVAARRDALRKGPADGAPEDAAAVPATALAQLLSDWLFGSDRPTLSPVHAWAAYAEALQTLQEEHAEAVGHAADALGELAAVRDALERLEGRFGRDGGSDGDGDGDGDGAANGRVSLRLHRDIVEEGIRALELRR